MGLWLLRHDAGYQRPHAVAQPICALPHRSRAGSRVYKNAPNVIVDLRV